MVHNHTWCDHPPEGPLSWGKSWDEKYFDTEALSENSEVKSEDYILDTLYTLELDPKFRFSEDLWPEVVEWCSSCKENRRVRFVSKEVFDKVQALDGKEDNVLRKVTLEEEIDSAVREQEEKAVTEVEFQVVIGVKEKMGFEGEKKMGFEVEELVEQEELAKELLEGEVLVEETLVVEEIARSNNCPLRQASTPKPPLPSISHSTTFWRPWETSCEATAVMKQSRDATTLLSSEGVTPPALVTPPRKEVRSSGRKVGRKLQRLLTFQATLEKEKGLPPSRWQRKLEFGEEGEATFIKTPVSHRSKGGKRGVVGEVVVSLSKQRGSRLEEVRSITSPQRPGYRGLDASRINPSLLHSYLSPGGWDGGGHRGFCYGCESWGNLLPIG